MTWLERAIYELPRNIVVAAGAGTGKTHRLTGAWIHLVAGLTELGPEVPADAIVATTFTREAAREMRARIEDRLIELAEVPLAKLATDPGKVWAQEMLDTCARRAVAVPPPTAFQRARERLPHAQITTFHAFAAELLRAYPAEAGIAPNYELLEPADEEALLSRATLATASRWLEDSKLERVELARLALSNGSANLLAAVQTALARIAEEGISPAEIEAADDERSVAKADALRARFFSALQDAVAARLTPKVPKDAGRDEVIAVWQEAQQAMVTVDDMTASVSRRTRAVREVANAYKTLRARSRAARFAHVTALLDTAVDGVHGTDFAAKVVTVLQGPRRAKEAMRLSGPAREFLATVDAEVEARKHRLRALGFGDVLRMSRQLLLRHPSVQIEVSKNIRALLVDEFQDTNAVQRDLVYLLRQSPSAAAVRPPGEPVDPRTLVRTGLLVVGDRKQSIYAFRGADVAVFQQILVDIAGEEARALGLSGADDDVPAQVARDVAQDDLGRLGQHDAADRTPDRAMVVLPDNRRSVPGVLSFVDAFCERDMVSDPLLGAHESVRFRPIERLRPVRTSTVAGPKVRLLDFGGSEDESAESTREERSPGLMAALGVAAEIRALVEGRRAGAEGPLRFGQMAILMRTYAVLPVLEYALALHEVPYDVAAGRGLFATREAWDLEAFVRLLVDRSDRHALLAVMRGPLVGSSDSSLLALARQGGLPRFDAHLDLDAVADEDERARVARLRRTLQEFDRELPVLGLRRSLERALDRLDFPRVLRALPGGEARVRDLARLVGMADEAPATALGFSDLGWFARQLTRGREGDIDEARGAAFDPLRDGVRIMTIHAAKGLEFPVVFVLQLEHGVRAREQPPLLVGRGPTGLQLAVKPVIDAQRDFALGGRLVAERGQAFEKAERQRLSYVAFTRARDLLYLIRTPSRRDPPAHSAARAVLELSAQGELVATLPCFSPVPSKGPSLSPERPGSSPPAQPSSAPSTTPAGFGPNAREQAAEVSILRGATVVATALSAFRQCPRRFQLLRVAGIPEPMLGSRSEPDEETSPLVPAAGLGARDEGTALHLALERAPLARVVGPGARAYAQSFVASLGLSTGDPSLVRIEERIVRFLEGAYARSLLEPGVVIERERAFAFALPSTTILRGTIDLCVRRPALPGGARRIEIVDYKSSERPDQEASVQRHALQLWAYALAASSQESEVSVRVGVAYLGSGDGDPVWLDGGEPLDRTAAAVELDRCASELLGARWRGDYPKVGVERCRMLRCGFLPICHPAAHSQPGDPEES